jgi:hypothetical protein
MSIFLESFWLGIEVKDFTVCKLGFNTGRCNLVASRSRLIGIELLGDRGMVANSFLFAKYLGVTKLNTLILLSASG